MIAVKLSVKQLVEALRGLTDKEKEQVRKALEKDAHAHLEQKTELTERYKNAFNDADLFKQGKLKTYPLSDLLDDL